MHTYDHTRPNITIEELRKRRESDIATSVSIAELARFKEVHIDTSERVRVTFVFKKDSSLRGGGRLTLSIDGQAMMNPHSYREQPSRVQVFSDTGRITVGRDFEVVTDCTGVHYTAARIHL